MLAYFKQSDSEDEGIERKRLKRWITIWCLREYSQLSFHKIGELMGGASKRSVEKFLTRNDLKDVNAINEICLRLEKCRM